MYNLFSHLLTIIPGWVHKTHSFHQGIKKHVGEEVSTITSHPVVAVLCWLTLSRRVRCWEPCVECRSHLPFLWHIYTFLTTKWIFNNISERRMLQWNSVLKKSPIKSTLVTNTLMNVLCIIDTKKLTESYFRFGRRWKQKVIHELGPK